MNKTEKKAGAGRAPGNSRKQTRIGRLVLMRSRAKDRAAAKSGVGGAAGKFRTDDAEREFPGAVYQDSRRT
jgi:hypothetical protein